MVSVFPCCYQFIFSIWVLKRQIEVSPCPSASPRLPPGDKGGQKSRKFLIPPRSTPRAPKHKPNSSHNASLLANLGSLPQRSASILNGNYYPHTHAHTHMQACIHNTCTVQIKCKRQRAGGGVQGAAQKKMRCSKKKKKKCKKSSKLLKKRENVGQKKKCSVCKCGVREFRRRDEV